VIYIGHIPHGFYEEQMRGFFSQFGIVTRVRLSRSKKVSVVLPPPPPPPPACTLSPSLPSLSHPSQLARAPWGGSTGIQRRWNVCGSVQLCVCVCG